MTKNSIHSAVLLCCVLVLSGCADLTSRSARNVDFTKLRHVFVEHRRADSYGVADEIARQLRELGYDASAGPLTMMPFDTDLIVSYDDMWAWDFKTYLIELDLQVRSAHSEKILAMGHYNRPSMVLGHPPAEMIHELITKLFRHA